MAPNQLVETGVGSVDWTGGKAPAGGAHTGTATITMQDATQFIVASNRAEVRRKLDLHTIGQTNPMWVAFDQPGNAIPLILNISNIQSVT